MGIDKKMRIQLFSKEGTPISDRLVTQITEFYQGPKEIHQGPMRIEFSIEDTKDTDEIITYLNQLRGSLPLKVVGTRGRKPIGATDSNEDIGFDARKALMDNLLDSKNQDEFIDKAREAGFVFVTSEHIRQIAEKQNVNSLPDYCSADSFEYLIKLIRRAKDPISDKYDLSMIFAIKILSGRSPRIRTWLLGEEGKAKLEIPEVSYTYKKTGLIKFPSFMNEDERLKWSREIRLLIEKPELKPSKFFKRWAQDTQVPDELKHKRFGDLFQ